jgi:hypothetical protein
MIRGKWRKLLTVTVACLTAFLVVGPSLAAQDENFRYGLENNNPVFLSREDANEGSSYRFAMRGGTQATIVAELVDIYSDDSGSKKAIPLGSSAFSPEGLVDFDEVISEYQPTGDFQYFDVSFRFKDEPKITRPVLGGLKISVVTQDAETQEFSVESSVVGTFSFFPAGKNLTFSPALTLSPPDITGLGTEFPPFGIIPDFPFLVNDGNFTIEYEFENTGDIFLETTSKVELHAATPFDQRAGEPIFDYVSEKSFLVPNQIATQRLRVAQSVEDGRVIEQLPYGIYTLTTSVNGSLGSENNVEDTSTQVIVIFPWKYTLFALLVLVLLRKRIVAAARAAKDLNQSWMEYRGTQKLSKPVAVSVEKPTVRQERPATPKAPAKTRENVFARKTVRSEGQFDLGPVSVKGFATLTRTNSVAARRIRVKSYKDLQSAPLGRRFTLKHNQSRDLAISFNKVSYRTPKITITWFEGFARFETELTVHSWGMY